MKQLFILMIAIGAVITASAQQFDRDHDYDRRDRVNSDFNNGFAYDSYHHGYYHDNRMDEIDTRFNRQVLEIRNDCTLSPWEKRKMIRRLYWERMERIREMRRWRNGDGDRWGY